MRITLLFHSRCELIPYRMQKAIFTESKHTGRGARIATTYQIFFLFFELFINKPICIVWKEIENAQNAPDNYLTHRL